jgi:hypothetical protein
VNDHARGCNASRQSNLGIELSEDYARSANSSVITRRARSWKKVSTRLVGCNINLVDMSVNAIIIEKPENIIQRVEAIQHVENFDLSVKPIRVTKTNVAIDAEIENLDVAVHIGSIDAAIDTIVDNAMVAVNMPGDNATNELVDAHNSQLIVFQSLDQLTSFGFDCFNKDAFNTDMNSHEKSNMSKSHSWCKNWFNEWQRDNKMDLTVSFEEILLLELAQMLCRFFYI